MIYSFLQLNGKRCTGNERFIAFHVTVFRIYVKCAAEDGSSYYKML